MTDHFDGKRFHNPGEGKPAGFGDLARWRATATPEPWPEWIPNRSFPPPPERAVPGELLYTLVNHSTLLIQTGEINILTDPIWSLRASPVSWTGPKRHRAPGIAFDHLPPIDLVLISHNHYDHLDRNTIKKLARRDNPEFLVPLGLGGLVKSFGGRQMTEMDWWDKGVAAGLPITCVPARHFSGRTLWDRNVTLWCGYVIETAAGRVYFAADTGFGPYFEEIRKSCGPIRLSFLPIGAFLPRWFMSPVHMGPEQAAHAHRLLGAEESVAIHFGTFALADDGPFRAADELRKLAAREGLRFRVPEFGETIPLRARQPHN